MSTLIKTIKRLGAFRKKFAGGSWLLSLIVTFSRLLINWQIGVGKSHALDNLVDAALASGIYDSVVVLAPTHQILRERRHYKNPPANIKVVKLKGRPWKKCGPLDADWKSLEQRGMANLGRDEICYNLCQKSSTCSWPQQFTKNNLQGANLIYAPQAYLENSPFFIDMLKDLSGAKKRILVLLDENNFAMKNTRRRVEKVDIVRFLAVLKKVNGKYRSKPVYIRLLRLTKRLTTCKTKDLRVKGWKFPKIGKKLTYSIQKIGDRIYGDEFNYILWDLQHFHLSRFTSREVTKSGAIEFSITPYIDHDFVVFSGTAEPEFLEYRLDCGELHNPYENYKFLHKSTTWFNIASNLGTRSYFRSNSQQILDFFAQLAVERIKAGKKVLFVAKKRFIPLCIKEMNERFAEFGLSYKVVHINSSTSQKKIKKLLKQNIVPIINYGVSGVNYFEKYHCAYCLTGYYVNEEIVNTILQDIYAEDYTIPIQITTRGIPRRRTASVVNFKDRFYSIQQLAPVALRHMEMDVVLQAVGRVRPYTMPREVITFQCSDHPQIDYTAEFNCIEDARNYFGIANRRQLQKTLNIERIRMAKENGMSQRAAAKHLNLGIATVKRYWNYNE